MPVVLCNCRFYQEALVDVFHEPTGTLYWRAYIHGNGGVARPAPKALKFFSSMKERDPDLKVRVYTQDNGDGDESVYLPVTECVVQAHHPFPWKRGNGWFETDGPEEVVTFPYHDLGLFRVTPTEQGGIHSGRRRFKVEYQLKTTQRDSGTWRVVHEATTGPAPVIQRYAADLMRSAI